MENLQTSEHKMDVITPAHVDRWLFTIATLAYVVSGSADSIAIEKAQSLLHQIKQAGY